MYCKPTATVLLRSPLPPRDDVCGLGNEAICQPIECSPQPVGQPLEHHVRAGNEQCFVAECRIAESSVPEILRQPMLIEAVQVGVEWCWLVAVDAEHVANSLPVWGRNHDAPTRAHDPPHFFERAFRFWEMLDDLRGNSAVERRISKWESLATGDDGNMTLIGRLR